MSETALLPSPSSFQDLGLPEPLLRTLDAAGFEAPSPLQARAVPPLLAGGDLLCEAPAGTGRTAAFVWPILARLDPGRGEVQALILVPGRERALHVAEAFQRFAAGLEGFHVLPVYGSVARPVPLRPLRPLGRGVQVVAGTPGGVRELLRRGLLPLEALQVLVLDETDEMLRLGHGEDLEWILEQAPSERQTALFAAAWPMGVRRLAEEHLHDPEEVRFQVPALELEGVPQRAWMGPAPEKLDALTRFLEAEVFEGMLVFVRTRRAAAELAEGLAARGWACGTLTGAMSDEERAREVERLRKKELDLLIATVASESGFEAEGVRHLVFFDAPCDVETYAGRIRAGGSPNGKKEALLFLTPRERAIVRGIEQATGRPVERAEFPPKGEAAPKEPSPFQPRDERGPAPRKPYERREGNGRPERPERSPRFERSEGRRFDKGPGRRPPSSRPEPGMERFRIEVGRVHGVTPGNIVGAIANESGLEGRYIGRIQLYDDFSTVDLPEGMPEETFKLLGRLRVRQQLLRIRRLTSSELARLTGPSGPPYGKPRKPYQSRR